MNNNVRNIIAAALLAIPIGAMAVPAQPGVVMRYQADGTVVPVRLEGDEFSHRVLSEDGWPMLEKQGTLYFAELSANGQLRPPLSRRHSACRKLKPSSPRKTKLPCSKPPPHA